MIRMVQVGEIMGPHQEPTALEMSRILGPSNFTYFSTGGIDHGRKALGWKDDASCSLVRHVDKKDLLTAIRTTKPDVVLCSNRNMQLFSDLVRNGVFVAYQSERWWKPPWGLARLLHPSYINMTAAIRELSADIHFHYLPIGNYAAQDMHRFCRFKERMRLWGYFPLVSSAHRVPRTPDNGPLRFRFLYVGRFIKLKRVDGLLQAFRDIITNGIDARLTIIGTGPQLQYYERCVSRFGLSDRVAIQGSLPMDAVWKEMRQHHALVLPSSGSEGWGAVVNEAMQCGCVPIVSRECGAGFTLIDHGKDGLIYPSGNVASLAHEMASLASQPKEWQSMAARAQEKMTALWSPQIAATRFISYAKSFLGGSPADPYADGPLSIPRISAT